MAGDFGDWAYASRFKDVIRKLVQEFLELERPRQIIGTVEYFDSSSNSVYVSFPRDPTEDPHDPVPYPLANIAPVAVGQTVVIDGPKGSRRVVAVLGDATFSQRERPGARIAKYTDQSISSSPTPTIVTMDTIEMERGKGIVDLANNCIVVPSGWSGPWLVGGQAVWGTTTSGASRTASIYHASSATTRVVAQDSHSTGGKSVAVGTPFCTFVLAGESDTFTLRCATDATIAVKGQDRASAVLWAVYMGNL